MALVLKDRVRESSTSSGTGSITLAGAYTGYQTFASAVTSGSTVYYTIHNTTSPNDNEWEVGVGTFTAPSTLSRDTVFSSSAGGSKVSFSGSSVLEVFITQPAEQAVYINDATGKVEVFGNGTNVVTFTEINTTNLTANTVTLTAGTISTNAANATDITNKQYVDGLFSTGISYHDPVRVESPTALSPVTYNNGSSGVGATLTNAGTQTALVIDGITLSLNDRVLIYTQTDQKQNGIYYVSNVGSGSTNWVLTRATDADTYGLADPNALGQGDAVFVQQGNTGAGETYICNTPGTIVFGTTNITFVQISSAQVYSAGTGLNLSNLTFSIANTTVVTGLYGDSANIAVIEVNPQGQLTSAANAAINVSNITVGTLDNARTTANASNGANTIVLRDSTGSFNANVVTATTVNATTGNFTNITANASGLTDINASNITSGTIANARTTGSTSNSASTLVLRDANGNFGSNVISASSFSGDGTAITAINASNISSGTIANARTTAASANGASTIVLRDSGGSFDANTVNAVSLIGNAAQVTNINASNISSGTIANARTTASSSNGASTIVLRGASGEFAAGAITGSLFTGNGSAISAINASNISTGTIDNARTTAASANGASTIVARDAGGNFAANTVTATTGSFTSVSGNGAAISAINASNISSGTIANARTTAASANGASTIVARDANGSFGVNSITGTGASFSPSTSAWASGAAFISSGSFGGGHSIVDGSAGFVLFAQDAGANLIIGQGVTSAGVTERFRLSSTGVVTASSFSGTHSGNGAALTDINASNITSGTISNARTTASSSNGASTIVSRDASGAFAAGAITATTGTFSGITSVTNSTASSNSSTGAFLVTGGVGIGGVTNFNNYINRITGSGNSAWLQQDGTGRVHWYWNTYGGTSPTFTNANEDASAVSLHITGTGAGGSFFHRSASGVGQPAGGAISWTTTLYTDLNTLTWKGNVILRADNYNSYSPTLTGGGASGTWGINVTGSASGLTSSNYITSGGSAGNWNTDFQNTTANTTRYGGDMAGGTNNPGGTWWFQQNYRHSNASNFWGVQVAWGWEDNANRLATRNVSGGSYGAWVYYLNSANVGTYALPIGGGTLTGALSGTSITGTSLAVAQAAPYLFLNRTSSGSGQMGIQFQNAGSSLWWNYVNTSATDLTWYNSVTATNVLTLTTSGLLASANGFRADSTGPFFLNATTVSANYTIPTNYNAVTAGTITINSGITVTVSTGSSWVIV